ncbi:hypothetical protein KFE25_007106 [Diacronema lutheri]|uniref:Small VCP/p97-interacting protein n=1 Tax=Diacronema lutheri TaxID=2081491 RepID=A0A8J6CCY8_DIALT|nr:hypothetical protein KFE25_007106 [Diacronema lutheri]
MGSCLGIESKEEKAQEEERNRLARLKAAEAATKRQDEYAATPHGRATKKSLENMKREQAAGSRPGDAPLMRWQVG